MRTLKRIRFTGLVAALAVCLGGCGNEQGASAGGGPGNDLDVGQIAAEDAAKTDAQAAPDTVGQPVADAGIKVDAGAPVVDAVGGSPDAGPADAGPEDAGEKPLDGGGGQSNLKWYKTCGASVCQGGPWQPTSGVPVCVEGEKVGDPCSTATQMCDNKDGCKAFLVCAAKDPKQQPGGCPISRRAFKTRISYLTPGDETDYAKQLQSLRLSTWAYREGDGRSHLGFILDDVPESIAVDGARDRVDLYSYISMAVAAIKVQQREIARLRAEVESLRGHTQTQAGLCQ